MGELDANASSKLAFDLVGNVSNNVSYPRILLKEEPKAVNAG